MSKTSSNSGFSTLTLLLGIVIGIVVVLFLLIFGRKRSQPSVISLNIANGNIANGPIALQVFSKRAFRRNDGNINSLKVQSAQQKENPRTILHWFKTGFGININSESSEAMTMVIEKENQVVAFISASLDSQNRNQPHSIRLAGKTEQLTNSIENSYLLGDLSNITWGLPSTVTKPQGYRFEGFTAASGWNLLTEIKYDESEQVERQIEISECTHIRLRVTYKFSTGVASIAIPIGSIILNVAQD